MKKRVPFPPAPGSSGASSTQEQCFLKKSRPPPSNPLILSSRREDSKEEDFKVLKSFLPSNHIDSRLLLSDSIITTVNTTLPMGVVGTVRKLEEGLVEVTILGGRETGYGCRPWRLRIGGQAGEGILGVRIVESGIFFHVNTDDTGLFDKVFWDSLDSSSAASPSNPLEEAPPLLHRIISHAIKSLTSPIGGDDSRFRAAEDHTFAKVHLISKYQPMAACKRLFDDANLSMDWIHPDMATSPASLAVEEVAPNIYVFDCFTESFCELLISELENFEKSQLPKRRPNSMNNYGLILSDIGLSPLIDRIMSQYLTPIAERLFPSEPVSLGLDHHHSFIVEYRDKGGDQGLDMHHDASEITVNICLGKSFQGSGLRFCGEAGSSNHRKESLVLQHKKGRAIMHLGRQRHGADNIQSGHRLNLIIWMRSSLFRSAASQAIINADGFPVLPEGAIPDKQCLSRFNDDDYDFQLQAIANQA